MMHSKTRKFLLATILLMLLLATLTGTTFASGPPNQTSGHSGSDQKVGSNVPAQTTKLHAKSIQAIPFANYRYDDTNPTTATDGNGHPCSSTAESPYSWSDDAVTIELRFSVGCQTAWARSTTSAAIIYTLSVIRINDDKSESFGYQNGGAYTYQLNDVGSLHSKACIVYVFIVPNNIGGSGCTSAW